MTASARIIAADDEPLALRRIELLLAQMPDVELAALAKSGTEALELVRTHPPDILLLDVKMADMDGLTVAALLPAEHRPLVIFVTAFDHFAVPAFEVEAVDYVVKPVEHGRLRRAIERAIARLPAQRGDGGDTASVPEGELWAERRGAFVRVPVQQIEWAESERDYVRLHGPDGSYLLRATLSEMQARLGGGQFLRIRRSVLVRRDRIASVRRSGYRNVLVRLISGAELRVGATFLKDVRSVLRGRINTDR